MGVQGRKVLVTGGAGLLGCHLVKLLLRERAIVRVVDRLEPKSASNLSDCLSRIEYIRGDLRSPGVAAKCVRGVDAVFHLAAKVASATYTESHDLEIGRDNIRIDQNFFEAILKETPDSLIYTSTGGIYDKGKNDGSPSKEGEAWNGEPNSLYGMVKLVGERFAYRVVERTKARLGILRFFSVYGPGEEYGEAGRVVPDLIRKVLLHEPYVVLGDGTQIRNFLFATDGAEALLLALENIDRIDRHPVNIGSGESITIKDLAALIRGMSPYSDMPQVMFDSTKPTGSQHMIPDTTLAKSLLGWTAKVSLREGLRRTFEWYKTIYRDRVSVSG